MFCYPVMNLSIFREDWKGASDAKWAYVCSTACYDVPARRMYGGGEGGRDKRDEKDHLVSLFKRCRG
jgi:hypothetical protein